MTEFKPIDGFEEIWRPVGGARVFDRTTLALAAPGPMRARLARITAHAPEAVVTVRGQARTRHQLRRHLDYISRRGDLALEGPDLQKIEGREALGELADEWSWAARVDSRDRALTPISRSMVLSMPSGVDPERLECAVRAFCAGRFGERFDYLFARHDDASHPHAHLVVRVLGAGGEHFAVRKPDLERQREAFAEALRSQDIEAEATPRRARGVTPKSEHSQVRRMRERYERGERPPPEVLRRAQSEAAELAFGGAAELKPWEEALLSRRRRIRAAYAGLAETLKRTGNLQDRALAERVETFLREMPPAQTRRFLLAEALRAAELQRRLERGRSPSPDWSRAEKERGRER